MKKSKVIKYEEFNCSMLNRDNFEKFIISTDAIKITKWGLPQLNDYITDDKSRNYIKLYLDNDQEECKKLEKIFKRIDEYLGNKQKFFGNLGKTYQYCPLIRKKVYDNGLEDEPIEKYSYCNLKFLTGHNDKIKTDITIKSDNNLTKPIVDTPSKLQKYLTIGSNVKMLMEVRKVWYGRKFGKQQNIRYGIDIKILNLTVIPKVEEPIKNGYFKKYFSLDKPSENLEKVGGKKKLDNCKENYIDSINMLSDQLEQLDLIEVCI